MRWASLFFQFWSQDIALGLLSQWDLQETVWSRGQGVKLWARCLTLTMLTPLTPPWGINFYLPTVWEMWQSRGREGVLPTMEQNPIQRGWKYSNLLNPFSWATGIWLLILPSGFHPFSFKFVQRILCLIKKTFEHSHQLFSGKCMDVKGWSNLFITSGRVRVNDVATWIGPNSISHYQFVSRLTVQQF